MVENRKAVSMLALAVVALSLLSVGWGPSYNFPLGLYVFLACIFESATLITLGEVLIVASVLFDIIWCAEEGPGASDSSLVAYVLVMTVFVMFLKIPWAIYGNALVKQVGGSLHLLVDTQMIYDLTGSSAAGYHNVDATNAGVPPPSRHSQQSGAGESAGDPRVSTSSTGGYDQPPPAPAQPDMTRMDPTPGAERV